MASPPALTASECKAAFKDTCSICEAEHRVAVESCIKLCWVERVKLWNFDSMMEIQGLD